MDLFSFLWELKGVAEKRSKLYEKLGLHTVHDLLYYFPRAYVDYSAPIAILAAPLEESSPIKGRVLKKLPEQNLRRGLSVYKATLVDCCEEKSDFTVTFYNNRYAFEALKEGEEYLLYGKVTGGFVRREMNSPQLLSANSADLIQPIYHLTAGLTNAMLHTNVKQGIALLGEWEFMPREILAENDLCTLSFALENIHFPHSMADLQRARDRLFFDELLTLQLGLLLLKGRNRELSGAPMRDVDITEFTNGLPFELTNAQKRSIGEIIADMTIESADGAIADSDAAKTAGVPMNRLLQGDVGSGKTAVAAAACYLAHKNGYQTAFMAPTEILSAQHFATLTQFLSPFGVKVALLTGSATAGQKAALKADIAAGKIDLIVGTHAIFQRSTVFANLGLVITDEQHRFGVNQRAALAAKGDNPHRLIMSATPIPRTLGLIIYGDLDISVLDEMPKGRLPIETFAMTGGYRERAYAFIKKQLDAGRQGYIVCSMIEDNDGDLHAVKSYMKKLEGGAFAQYSLGLLHGKLSAAEKEKTMAAFKAGEVQLMISTTVIEVGVDVPNANIMLIENAERFGLSQLHQLRGRVGRGNEQSYCVLISEHITDDVRERLNIICKTVDGFKLAEEDMRLRGCGDFFGERQHGLPPLKLGSLDSELIWQTQDIAKTMVERDPTLSECGELRGVVERMFIAE